MKRPGSVYFIIASGSKRVKIGCARDPFARLSDLQVGSPEPLILLAHYAANDCEAEERSIHRLFAAQRLHGEWFECSDELLRFAAGMANAPEDEIRAAAKRRIAQQRAVAAHVVLSMGFRELAPPTDFAEVALAWRLLTAWPEEDSLARLAPLEVLVAMSPSASWRAGVDLWESDEVAQRAEELADVQRAAGALYWAERRVGTRTTARMLLGAHGDQEDTLAVLLLAIEHELTGRSGRLPEAWRGEPERVFLTACKLARERVSSRPWAETYHRRSTSSMPGFNPRLNDLLLPTTTATVAAIVRVHAVELMLKWRLVRLVPAVRRAVAS